MAVGRDCPEVKDEKDIHLWNCRHAAQFSPELSCGREIGLHVAPDDKTSTQDEVDSILSKEEISRAGVTSNEISFQNNFY